MPRRPCVRTMVRSWRSSWLVTLCHHHKTEAATNVTVTEAHSSSHTALRGVLSVGILSRTITSEIVLHWTATSALLHLPHSKCQTAFQTTQQSFCGRAASHARSEAQRLDPRAPAFLQSKATMTCDVKPTLYQSSTCLMPTLRL